MSDPKQFRDAFTRCSRLLEPLTPGERKRILSALATLLVEEEPSVVLVRSGDPAPSHVINPDLTRLGGA